MRGRKGLSKINGNVCRLGRKKYNCKGLRTKKQKPKQNNGSPIWMHYNDEKLTIKMAA